MKPGLGWRVVECLARMLDESECEAVLGDIAESGENWGQALWDVSGLVVRREGTAFTGIRSWPVLLAIIIPFGLLISVSSRLTSGETSVYFWMYANNWDWGLLRNWGFWYVLAEVGLLVFAAYLTLACWSWTIGFLIGAVSRKYIRTNALLIVLVLLLGEIAFAPFYLNFCQQSFHRVLDLPPLAQVSTDPVSALSFYRVTFPLLLQMILAVLPALSGIHHGARMPEFRRTIQIGIWSITILSLAGLVVRDPGFGLLRVLNSRPPLGQNYSIQWLTPIAYWPAVYLVVYTVIERWRTRAVRHS